MLINEPPFIIFSVFTCSNSEGTDTYNHSVVQKYLAEYEIKYKEVLGNYKGAKELSFLLADNTANRELAMSFGLIHRQESILLVDNNRMASLYFLNGDLTEPLGEFVRINSEDINEESSWTLDFVTNQFWGIKHVK